MEQWALYLVLKNMIKDFSDDFKITFNDRNELKEKLIAIYIKGGMPSKYRSIKNGKYYCVNNRVEFVIQGSSSFSDLIKVYDIVDKIKDTLITTYNILYSIPLESISSGDITTYKIKEEDNNNIEEIEQSEYKQLQILNIDLMGDTSFDGKTSQGFPVYCINFSINYNFIN